MFGYFDTSAIVPLLLEEPHSEPATRAWYQTESRYAWQWLRVEAEAALTRRKATPESWERWQELQLEVNWIEPEDDWTTELRLFNRGIGLRAADAGHLFLMERCLAHRPSLQLITLDKEMRAVALQRGLKCLPD